MRASETLGAPARAAIMTAVEIILHINYREIWLGKRPRGYGQLEVNMMRQLNHVAHVMDSVIYCTV